MNVSAISSVIVRRQSGELVTVDHDVHVDALIDPRICERDQRMPVAVQVSAVLDAIRALEMGGRAVERWMDLQRRLRRQPQVILDAASW